jgi:polyhydroxybutyrate depolymerase
LRSLAANAALVLLFFHFSPAPAAAQGVAELECAGLTMDTVADRAGFIVAYLSGTPVTRLLGTERLGWNAGGGCCGLSAKRNVDDVGYVRGAIDLLVSRYGIDRDRIFGIGHSNGAMMTQRFVCETGIYAAAVAISGPQNRTNGSCEAARGASAGDLHAASLQGYPPAPPGYEGIPVIVHNPTS